MRNEYSTLEIVKALGLTRERLQDWMNRGFVKPSIEAKGQGTKAIFTHQDVYKIDLFRLLLEKGFKRNQAAKLIGLLTEIRECEYVLFMHWRLEKGLKKKAKSELLKRGDFVVMPFADYKSVILWLSVLSKSTWTESSQKYAEKLMNSDMIRKMGEGVVDELDIMQIVNISGIRKRVDMALDNIESSRNER